MTVVVRPFMFIYAPPDLTKLALDTNSPLPLFNSLTHLTYLTSTSPRIREIMVMDGGLERLVRMLHDFCLSPPPPENPALLYGLLPPNYHPPKPVPTLIPKAFDKHAAYRFSLAFQCIVNIGVRGSELIRSRVVQAGTLDVVGCILESWLASKGFAVGPSSSATGMPRETREQRAARKQVQAEMRARQQAAELARALERRQDISHDISMQTIRGRSRPSDFSNRTIVPAADVCVAFLTRFHFLKYLIFIRMRTEWTHLRIPLPYRTTLAPRRLTYRALTLLPLHPTPRRQLLAVTQTHRLPLRLRGIRRQQGRTHLQALLKFQGATEAARLSHAPSGILPPLPHAEHIVHVIVRALSPRLLPAEHRVLIPKQRTMATATSTWTLPKKVPTIRWSAPRRPRWLGVPLPLSRTSRLTPVMASPWN
jgi:hypothetical protein